MNFLIQFAQAASVPLPSIAHIAASAITAGIIGMFFMNRRPR